MYLVLWAGNANVVFSRATADHEAQFDQDDPRRDLILADDQPSFELGLS